MQTLDGRINTLLDFVINFGFVRVCDDVNGNSRINVQVSGPACSKSKKDSLLKDPSATNLGSSLTVVSETAPD